MTATTATSTAAPQRVVLAASAAAVLASGANAGIALAASGARQHYTIALWPAALRDALREYLERGERRVGAFIARHGAAVASWPAEPVDPFLNVNTPEDLAAAEVVDLRSGSEGHASGQSPRA